jgi:cell division protein FtsL
MAKRSNTKAPPPRSSLLRPQRLAALVLIAAAVWVGFAFAQKMYAAYQLNAEAQSIQRENDRIAQANKGYQQQLDALSRPDGAEEQLRQHSYTRPDENRYVVALPTPTPPPSPGTSPAAQHNQGFWSFLWNLITSPFHH